MFLYRNDPCGVWTAGRKSAVRRRGSERAWTSPPSHGALSDRRLACFRRLWPWCALNRRHPGPIMVPNTTYFCLPRPSFVFFFKIHEDISSLFLKKKHKACSRETEIGGVWHPLRPPLLPPCRAGAPQTCFGLAAPRGLLGERTDIRSFTLLLPFAQDRFAALETDSQLSTSFQDKIVAFWRHTPMVFSRKHEGLLPKQDTVWVFCKTRNGSWLEKPTKKSWRLTKKNRLNFWRRTWCSTLSRVP